MHREFIQKLTNLVEANLANEKFGPDDLAREAGMSRSNLNRKLRIISNQNISQFIREIRLKKAKELLENEELTAAEIAYRVGFGSATYFNKCFREYYGVAPGEIRNHEPEIEPEIKPDVNVQKQIKRINSMAGILIGLLVTIPIIYFVIQKIGISDSVEDKSVAVLPFINLSDEIENQYQTVGMMDAILSNLSKIKDLRVISRTSVEQYRDSKKTVKTIGKELEVGYLLEGSLQKGNNKARLIVQLIRTKNENHVWSKIYDYEGKDLFSVQSEVAVAVAGELQAIITPLEQQLIRKIPTTNLTAYDYYIRGKEELNKYEYKTDLDFNTLEKAQNLFQKALELDSTFALAYSGLAAIKFWTSGKDYLSENYMDSVLILANKALAYDPQSAEAYYFRGCVYSETSKITEAFKEIEIALEFNPNDWKAYRLKSFIYNELHDYVKATSSKYEVILRDRGPGLQMFLRAFSYHLSALGFPDLAKKYNQQSFELYGDSTEYLFCSAFNEYADGNFENAYQISKKADKRDSTFRYLHIWPDIATYSIVTGRYDEAYSLGLKYTNRLNNYGGFDGYISEPVAYYLWHTGRKREAEFYINKIIDYHQECIKLNRMVGITRSPHLHLAEMYALVGNREKAYYHLDEVNKIQAFPLNWLQIIKYEPYFDNIRQEPRFQKILKDIEAKYQTEHDRIRKWFVEEGLL
jgi:TolB-like protein/AraC-like DNA-binding protein